MTHPTLAERRPRSQSATGGGLSPASRLKGGGYLTSTISVALLAVPGLKAALEQPPLFACLAGGVVASIAGMALRWRAQRLEQMEKGD